MTARYRLGAPTVGVEGPKKRPRRYDPRLVRASRLAAFALALVGALAGIGVAVMHVLNDPIADAQAYYAASTRLNNGEALYPHDVDPSTPLVYLYPPLLAVLLRPLALLPYHVFALAWEAIVLASFVLLIRQLRPGFWGWILFGILGVPIGWALSIGQAHVPLTLLLAIGQPWSVALAANLKVFPALVALWWIGRRDYESFIAFLGYMLVIGLLQMALEPVGTFAFLQGGVGFAQLGEVRNISPFAVLSPVVWGILLAGGILATIALARSKFGWAAAVALGTLSPPRLLVYMLMGLLAGLRRPRVAGEKAAVPDAATAYVQASR